MLINYLKLCIYPQYYIENAIKYLQKNLIALHIGLQSNPRVM